MVKDSYIALLENPDEIQQVHTASLKSVVDEYPYFQSAHALYLKALKTQESFKYNNKLKLTASYTTDREILFDFITSDIFNISTKINSEVDNTALVSEEKSTEIKTEIVEIEQDLEIGKPLSFSKNETHSFQQWLQLSVNKPIVREEKPAIPDEKLDIIDRFIANNPKISKLDKTSNSEVKIVEESQYPQLMTETLAKVYLEQKKYENAIKAYEILSLKYPEKSGFFADQINRIRILQKK